MAFRRYRFTYSLTAEQQQTRIQLRGSGGISPPSRTSQVSLKSRCERQNVLAVVSISVLM
jgi:hypothetical protein